MALRIWEVTVRGTENQGPAHDVVRVLSTYHVASVNEPASDAQTEAEFMVQQAFEEEMDETDLEWKWTEINAREVGKGGVVCIDA